MATPPFLVRLMNYASLARGFKLGPEDREACCFANSLRQATMEGRLAAVWTHPANELAGMVTVVRGKVRVPAQVALARALGLITGTSDYLFLWDGGSLSLEFKSETGSLTPGQRDWRDWCAAQGVPFHLVRSEAEGLALLRQYGRLS